LRSSDARFRVNVNLFSKKLRVSTSFYGSKFYLIGIAVESFSHQVAPVAYHVLLFFELHLLFLFVVESFLRNPVLFNEPLPVLLFVSLPPAAELDVSNTALDQEEHVGAQGDTNVGDEHEANVKLNFGIGPVREHKHEVEC
jgi:hypothetical protein